MLVLAAVACSAALASPMPGAKGCTVFPADNAWNRRVDALPVAADSAAIVNSIGPAKTMHADFGSGLWDGGPIGIPITTVGAAQPKSKVSFEYADESDRGPYPIPATVKIEGGAQADGDRHALIVDRDTCRLYELYALRRVGGRWTAGSGAIWDLRSNRLRPAGWTSADAAGLPILPGLARYDEVARGRIDHALRFTVSRTRRAYVWPARHVASSVDRSGLAADGPAAPAEAELRHRGVPAAGAHRSARAAGVRDGRCRQRLRLVRLGRARPALEQRRSPFARPCARIGVRGRRPGLDPASPDVTLPALSTPPAARALENAASEPISHQCAFLPPPLPSPSPCSDGSGGATTRWRRSCHRSRLASPDAPST